MKHLNTDVNMPLYQQLYEQIKQRVVSGEYREGACLISTRKLAKDLCVGRNTVESAYDLFSVGKGKADCGHGGAGVRFCQDYFIHPGYDIIPVRVDGFGMNPGDLGRVSSCFSVSL